MRLGPDRVERAYHEARRLGYEPLALGLAEVDLLAMRLASENTPSWMQMFLEGLAEGARKADLSKLGMSRERFKREWRDLVFALTASTVLASVSRRLGSELSASDSSGIPSCLARFGRKSYPFSSMQIHGGRVYHPKRQSTC
jgi:hypothetical protein